MKRQRIQLLFLLTALLLLAGGFLILRQRRQNQERQEAEADETSEVLVLDVAAEEVVKLSYEYEGENCSFEKEEDTWYVAGDRSREVAQYTVSSMVSGVAPLKAEQVIGEVTDLGQYGLEEPETITFATADASYSILVGETNNITDVCYIKLPENPEVYAVKASLIRQFEKGLDEVAPLAES